MPALVAGISGSFRPKREFSRSQIQFAKWFRALRYFSTARFNVPGIETGTPHRAWRCTSTWRSPMRMPILSYFFVVGAVLTGLLLWFGDDGDLQGAPLRTSQQVGVPKPFKGQPESMPDVTNVNFAAARELAPREKAAEKSAKPAVVGAKRTPRAVVRTWTREAPARNSFAEFPHDNLMSIH
jgi:hypothetical protein